MSENGENGSLRITPLLAKWLVGLIAALSASGVGINQYAHGDRIERVERRQVQVRSELEIDDLSGDSRRLQRIEVELKSLQLDQAVLKQRVDTDELALREHIGHDVQFFSRKPQ